MASRRLCWPAELQAATSARTPAYRSALRLFRALFRDLAHGRVDTFWRGRMTRGSSVSAVRIERTAHPVPSGDVSADQRHCVVRDRIELSTFRFSGQPRYALCRPVKTDVTHKRNRARRKVRHSP